MSDPKEELQRDVERTRRELGETVEALAHKVDVPGRVKEQAQETRLRMAVATNQAVDSLPEPVAVQVERARRHPGAIAAALIALVLAIWAISRRNG
ncbi:Protein of unknown function [Lentzea waywayandensis]|uniref:DUF3618 domain-containing protein n=1 Tax=Lentzea waywayandensis TaxID=84724 RepID=A0A1I6F3V7_9PSEU|nr:DUF3618 domain-containing protein [Lentzea waywayandensis]SFR24685.1 Protein of unknown function [Lentzea waywayandensis]